MIERPHLQELIKRISEPRKFLQVIIGPRQVGKTTMVQQLLAHWNLGYVYISADGVAASNNAWLEQQWETARLRIDIEGAAESLLVIDEIQKIDNWSEVVKKLWDADTRNKKNIKVILLGSSRLLLQTGLTESLAGRFETIYMGHWSYNEMKNAFGWTEEQYVWFGGYPGSAELINNENRWKAYVQQSLIETSISRDILMLTRVDKPSLMKRLFELGCHYSGQILSYTKIMGQLQDAGNTTTLSHYLKLLETAGLIAGIEKFSKDIIRKRSSSPKFQVYNTALISAQRMETFQEIIASPADWGRMVESAVGAHLINCSITGSYSLHYWKERNDEVDFVIEKTGRIIAIEVKSNSSAISTGMNAFKKQFNPDRKLLVGESGFHWKEFLKINPMELFQT